MQNTPRTLLMQFAHLLQQELFPRLEQSVGELGPQLQLLAAVVSLVPLERFLSPLRARTGRPAKDRAALATAFIAKAVLNLASTRDLRDRLQVDEALRRFCGWHSPAAVPHESKFSRAFAQFAAARLAERLHAEVVDTTQGDRLIGHIARDSTAIVARERFAERPPADRRRKRRAQGKRGKRPGPFARAQAAQRGTRIERQRHQSLEQMLAELPRECDLGAKTNSQGNQQYWRGFKLHLDVADGQIPISAYLTSASVHDSQVAIPLMHTSTQRVDYCYELMDSAYDADAILAESRAQNHVPIVAPHPRRGTKKPSQCPQVFPVQPRPQLDWAQQQRYRERTMSERINGRLKDEFGGNQVRVRGPVKVMAHLCFGLLALTVDQWLRLAGAG